MAFQGLRVLAFESRRALEVGELIRKQGGQPVVAPSLRELPLEEDESAYQFAERLFRGELDMVVLMTGVGVHQLKRVLSERYAEQALADALRKITVVARGPKPVAVLREMGIKPALTAPEPNTWREVLAVTEGRPERRIAIQEYGRSNPELIAGFQARGAEVMTVRVYQYGLPEDTAPLRDAARRLASGEVDVALFTAAVQIEHLAAVAREAGLEEAVLNGLRRCRVCSIGPTTTEALEQFGIHPDLEPSHPKLGILVREAAEACGPLN
jgi:uroporphyrinogen-III synthase